MSQAAHWLTVGLLGDDQATNASATLMPSRQTAKIMAWIEKAWRKNCAAKACSWYGSVKEPVRRCIVTSSAATARSGSCSLRGSPGASRAAGATISDETLLVNENILVARFGTKRCNA